MKSGGERGDEPIGRELAKSAGGRKRSVATENDVATNGRPSENVRSDPPLEFQTESVP